MIFLEDGTKATVGVICQPCTCSRLVALRVVILLQIMHMNRSCFNV